MSVFGQISEYVRQLRSMGQRLAASPQRIPPFLIFLEPTTKKRDSMASPFGTYSLRVRGWALLPWTSPKLKCESLQPYQVSLLSSKPLGEGMILIAPSPWQSLGAIRVKR